MYQYKGLDDTIAAVATALGAGGIGVVRLSGPRAVEMVDGIFNARSQKRLYNARNFSLTYGWIMAPEKADVKRLVVDEVLVSVMRAPHSYTKQDVVEISCHGGPVAQRTILKLVLEQGARLAEPGEFTKRAFLNGRIDLAQAEAVLDIINAKTDSCLRVSSHQLKGELSLRLDSLREQLLSIYTEIEAIVNFPEDEINASTLGQIAQKINDVLKDVQQLLAASEQGRILRDGAKIVLCGRPNVGKSSLLNVLLRQPRAIVSAMAGTTRDTIEETAQIQGVPLQLVDTAGILEPRDLVEEEAIKRSRLSIESADLVLLVMDASQSLTPDDVSLAQALVGRPTLLVLNKCDLPVVVAPQDLEKSLPGQEYVKVSALQNKSVHHLEQAIVQRVLQGKTLEPGAILVSNLRHIQCLRLGLAAIERASETLDRKISLEFVSEDIKSAVNELDAITGRNVDQDLLDKIFSDFCIGK